jgi:hypothetical protein
VHSSKVAASVTRADRDFYDEAKDVRYSAEATGSMMQLSAAGDKISATPLDSTPLSPLVAANFRTHARRQLHQVGSMLKL